MRTLNLNLMNLNTLNVVNNKLCRIRTSEGSEIYTFRNVLG